MRSLRNNNPLNIRHGSSRWQGMAKEQKDEAFVTFKSTSMGYRAAWILLRNYHRLLAAEGLSYNLGNIIHRWAPPEDDNNTTAYTRRVLQLCAGKVTGRQPLPLPDTEPGHHLFTEIIAAMSCVEGGIAPAEVDRAAIEHGWQLAFG